MVSIVKTINGQKKLIPLTSDVGSGVPLGTLVAFSDDTPKDGYLQTGTSFDETKYPALYALLGSNQIPAMFDHSRPSDYESITLSTDSNNPTVMDYDGVLLVKIAKAGFSPEIFINGTSVGKIGMSSSSTGTNTYGNVGTLVFKKGDSIYSNQSNADITYQVAYYKHPLFIKATSGLAENQQENILNTLNNNLSYSTEEHATGRKWIDGKMIYSRVIETTFGNSSSINIDSGLNIIKFDGYVQDGNRRVGVISGGAGGDPGIGLLYNKSTGAFSRSVQGTFSSSSPFYVILEYTKTT